MTGPVTAVVAASESPGTASGPGPSEQRIFAYANVPLREEFD